MGSAAPRGIGRYPNDALFKILSNAHRRYFLYDLLERGTLTVDEVEAAADEWVADAGPADETDPGRTLTTLYYVPMMEKAGLITVR